MSSRPEVLAPAGDEEAMRAAIRAGADAVYFGVRGFNARARAANFDIGDLRTVLDELHAHGVKGYVTLNTLVFDHELPALEETVRACAAAGVDAIIVQDLGVLRLARAIAPDLPVHASTQMTCTDAASVELATELGASRVVVARELSLDEIEAIRRATPVELEVFVHGALCVSYSGQCLTSEAIGGRSANRGACAQACRLPYDLVVDGRVEDLGERAYLLSPQDLEASALVDRLAALGVSSLKIEGRLKGPEYVASATRLYRTAVDNAVLPERATERATDLGPLRQRALVTYSRGSGQGFLGGVNHQSLVEGTTCEHRGLVVGTVRAVERSLGEASRGRRALRLLLDEELARGAGVLVEGGRAGEGERGGRVWDLVVKGESVARAPAGADALVWLGPDVPLDDVEAGRRLFKNDDPEIEKLILTELEREPYREPLDLVIRGALGAPFRLEAQSARGLRATVTGDAVVEEARERALDEALLADKLGRLGDSPFALRALTVELPARAAVPPSSLNRARRALVQALVASASRSHSTRAVTADDLVGQTSLPAAPPPPGLFVLCRTQDQAEAALDAGADGVWLDFLALTGTSRAIEELRARREGLGRRFQIGVAPPRIRKPGEEKIDRFLLAQRPDAMLVRSLGALRDLATLPSDGVERPLFIGDFSLNVTNRLSADVVLGRGLAAFTPSFDLDAAQLDALLSTLGTHAELVVHHPMPLFHTEHCVFASLLSEGRDHRSCGRPCERHVVSLRDRVGLDNPVEADVGCRNTVFHAQPQSAAAQVPAAWQAGVRRFRIELVRESAADVRRVVEAYRGLLEGRHKPAEVFRALRTEEGYGVVRGSLRVLT